MTALRFTQKTHPVVLACFVDQVKAVANAQGMTLTVYEDGRHDPIDFSAHLRPGVFTWHARSKVFRWFGVDYGCAADLNAKGRPGLTEEQFFKRHVWPLARDYGVAIRWEGGTHAHTDCGGDNAFGGDSRIPGNVPTNYRIGSPNLRKTGVIAVDGGFGPVTVRKVQMTLEVPVTGVLDRVTVKAIQRALGVPQDGLLGPKTKAAWTARLGTRVPWRGNKPPAWVATCIQVRLNLHNRIY